MSNFEIREITSAQSRIYKDFTAQGFTEDANAFRIAPEDDVDAPFPTNDTEDSFTLGMYENNVLAGVVSFERDGKNRRKLRHKGILFRMYVSSKFRGKGYSKLLMKAVIERVKKIKDIEQINLTVISSNEAAKSLYKQYNFVTYSSEKNAVKWNGSYLDEDSMALKL